jgi:flagellar assembly protein FliH
VRSIVEEARNWHQEVLTYSERAVIDLVEDIAKTIFCDGVTLEPDLLGKVFRRALSEAKTLGDLRIHVNPEDEAAMHPHWAKEQASMIGQRIEMIPDRSIKRGGCMIEGKYGSVDARVETQYKAAMGAISDVAELNGVQE